FHCAYCRLLMVERLYLGSSSSTRNLRTSFSPVFSFRPKINREGWEYKICSTLILRGMADSSLSVIGKGVLPGYIACISPDSDSLLYSFGCIILHQLTKSNTVP